MRRLLVLLLLVYIAGTVFACVDQQDRDDDEAKTQSDAALAAWVHLQHQQKQVPQ